MSMSTVQYALFGSSSPVNGVHCFIVASCNIPQDSRPESPGLLEVNHAANCTIMKQVVDITWKFLWRNVVRKRIPREKPLFMLPVVPELCIIGWAFPITPVHQLQYPSHLNCQHECKHKSKWSSSASFEGHWWSHCGTGPRGAASTTTKPYARSKWRTGRRNCQSLWRWARRT